MVLGIDLVCRLGMATKYGPNTTGWMLTPLYGYFGAALAAGQRKLVEVLDAQRAYREQQKTAINNRTEYWQALNKLNSAVGVPAVEAK